jgi:hypothetical protein
MPFIISNTTGTFKYASQKNFDKYNEVVPQILAPVTISSSISGWSNSTDVSGTSVTNGVNYNVYSFKPTISPAATPTTYSYTLTYSTNNPTYIYVHAVGGGGAGGAGGGPGGGGGGGVVMMPVYVPSTGGTNQTITITVGGGVSGRPATTVMGGNTTVVFNAIGSYATKPNSLIAGGGGTGTNGTPSMTANIVGGSPGGNYNTAAVLGNNTNYNYANASGYIASNCSGGGGAGTAGYGANGGNGIQCFLPGIKDFNPSGTSYGYYYWGGGGGGYPYTTVVGGNNGGFGGAGSGTGAAISYSPYGINNPTNGGIDAGANTGSGGGGSATGNGGSGIVIIAFPKSIVLTNASAVLPSIVYNSGKYCDVLSNDSFGGTKTSLLSTSAYSSAKGAFACKLINYNYFGPTMILRHSVDTIGKYTKNFYSDIFGNMGTGYMGTGQSVSSWLAAAGADTTYAYVVKWYNQGMDVSFNCATQYTLTSQPIYDVSNNLINFGYTGANGGVAALNNLGSFNLPDGALPYDDTSYTYSLKHWNIGGGDYSSFFWGGNQTLDRGGTAIDYVTNKYFFTWYGDDLTVPSTSNATTKNVVSFKYSTGSSRYGYVNGVSSSYARIAERVQPNINNFIGKNAASAIYHIKAQMYYFYVFGSSLSDTDRILTEATPDAYTPPTTISLTLSNVTATNFTLTTTLVSEADYFVVYVNSNVAYTSSRGLTSLSNVSITPVSSSPWYINVYAYNSTNNLLSSGLIRYFSGQVLPVASGQSYPSALTSNTFSISNIDNIESFANGTYVCSSSSYSTGMLACNLFDPSGTGTQWQAYYTGAGTNPAGITYTQDPYNGAYRGGGSGASTFNTIINSVGTIGGDWFQVNTPFSFVLTSYYIATGGRTMAEYYLVGSSNGSTWYKLDFVTGRTTSSPIYYTISPTPTVAYKYYRIIVTVSMFGAGNGEVANLNSWYLYGNVIY